MNVTLSSLVESRSYDIYNKDEDLEEVFSVAKNLGFDGVDYLGTIPDAFFSPKKAIELSKKYNIPVLCMHAPLHLLVITPMFLMERTLKTIRYFPKLEVINFHLSGFLHPFDPKGKSLTHFLKIAKKQKAPVSFESNPLMLGLGRYPKETYDPDIFANFCIKHNLPITFDTSHVAHCNYDVLTFFKKYYKHIKLIHLSDANGKIQHLPLGKGMLPIKELLQEIKKVRFAGTVTFEIANFPKGTSPKEKVQEIAQSFAMVNRYAR